MHTENDSKSQVREDPFFKKQRLSVVEKVDDGLKTNALQNSKIKDDTFSNRKKLLDKHSTTPDSENIEITLWRNRKIRIKKPLIPVRISFFLWFASGSLFSPFFVLILTHRGLALSEFSSVFPVLFVAQLAVGYICGIIADKLGNAKPVLIFLMSSSICIIIGLLLSPDVRQKSCLEYHTNFTCSNVLNYTSDLEYCEQTCSKNNTKYFVPEVYHSNTNESIAISERIKVPSSKEKLEDAFNSNGSIVFCDEVCFCLNQSEKNCSYESKEGLKILYYAYILSFFSVWSTSYRFLDFTSLNLANEHNSHFGKERMFGQIGALFSTSLCNFVLQIDKSGTREYYDTVYWIAVLLGILAVISACNMQRFILPPGLNLSKTTLKLFTDIEIVSLICVAFAAGIPYSFNNFYHVWFLDSLEASKSIIGFYIMSNSVYSLPLYATSKWWIKKLGIKTLIIISFLGYTVNGISYSFLYSAWPSLFIQVTKAFSFYLFWIALVVHCRKIAPEGFAATVNSVVGTVYTGVGRSFSVSVGGHLLSTFGARTTYRILAGFCFTNAILYSTFLYLRHLFSKKAVKSRSVDPEEMQSMRKNED